MQEWCILMMQHVKKLRHRLSADGVRSPCDLNKLLQLPLTEPPSCGRVTSPILCVTHMSSVINHFCWIINLWFMGIVPNNPEYWVVFRKNHKHQPIGGLWNGSLAVVMLSAAKQMRTSALRSLRVASRTDEIAAAALGSWATEGGRCGIGWYGIAIPSHHLLHPLIPIDGYRN